MMWVDFMQKEYSAAASRALKNKKKICQQTVEEEEEGQNSHLKYAHYAYLCFPYK